MATAYERGWSTLKNGALLEAAERSGFGVLLTSDKNLRRQQNLSQRSIAIVELPTNSVAALLPHFDEIANAVRRIKPGEYIALSF